MACGVRRGRGHVCPLAHAQGHEKCGSLLYCAPERVVVPSGGYACAPAEVWSLGVLLWVMVTGAFPFRGMRCVRARPCFG